MARAIGEIYRDRFSLGSGGGDPDPDDGWELLHEETFDGMTVGDPMTLTQGRQWLGDPDIGGSTTFNCFAVVNHDGGQAMVYQTPAGTFGTGDGIGLGANVNDPLSTWISTNGLLLAARLDFDVMFPLDMDWDLGGKLPGLAGSISGSPPSGCPGAGTYDDFSARLMWWPNGRLNSYRYWPGFTGACGEDRQSAYFFTPGQLVTVRHEIVLNTFTGSTPNADGIDRVLVDEGDGFEEIILDEDMIWRTSASIPINFQSMSFFRGGSDMSWAGDVDNEILVDNYRIYVKAA